MLLNSVHKPAQMPSNREFGLFFATVFTVIVFYTYWKGKDILAITASIIAISFLSITLAFPQLLTKLNLFWYNLGMVLGKITNPIVLGIIFFVIITPTSLIIRLFRRDELKIRKQYVESYWIDRSPPGPSSPSFYRQY